MKKVTFECNERNVSCFQLSEEIPLCIEYWVKAKTPPSSPIDVTELRDIKDLFRPDLGDKGNGNVNGGETDELR